MTSTNSPSNDSLILTIAIQFAKLQSDFCHAVGNFLKEGAIRIRGAATHKQCLIGNGRSCIADPNTYLWPPSLLQPILRQPMPATQTPATTRMARYMGTKFRTRIFIPHTKSRCVERFDCFNLLWLF